MGERFFAWRQWQFDDEFGASLLAVAPGKASAMNKHDLIADRQPSPLLVSFVLTNGSKIRSPNSAGIPGPVSAILTTSQPGERLGGTGHSSLSSGEGQAIGLMPVRSVPAEICTSPPDGMASNRIEQQIQIHLAKLLRVANNVGHFGRKSKQIWMPCRSACARHSFATCPNMDAASNRRGCGFGGRA